MKTSMFPHFLSTFVLAVVLLPSCSATKLSSVWRDDGYKDHPKKIMIIGGFKKMENRELFEDGMVRQLKALGTDAVASYVDIPEPAEADRDKVIAIMNVRGADAVLISRLTDNKSVASFRPNFGSGFYGFYSASTGAGQMVRDEFIVVQTNLYDLKTDKLVWTAATDTWMSEDDNRLIRSFISIIIDRLARDRVLASEPES